MILPWHRDKPRRLAELRADVESFCSTLHVFLESDVVFVRGTFPVRYGGEDLDAFQVEIELPANFPNGLPIVREKGGRLPWTAERHVYTNGNACVLLPEDRWWSYPPDRPFAEYLGGPLHNYFLQQSIVDAGGGWPLGEHHHGWYGAFEFYQEKFGTKDAAMVLRCLELIAEGKARGHAQCTCGSGKRVRLCHPGIIEVARKMPAAVARKSLDSLVHGAKQDSSRSQG